MTSWACGGSCGEPAFGHGEHGGSIIGREVGLSRDDSNTYVDPEDIDAPTAKYSARPTLPQPRFRVDDELARGGLGRVHRGWDTRLDREVAIKSLLGHNTQTEARFDREMQLTARLQHPNIVPVYDGGRDPEGSPFLAMRLVHGRSLGAAIKQSWDLSERLTLLPHVIDACNAVAYAHSKRIAHRDLKPDNVLVGDFGETVVIDWGLAKDLDAEDIPTFSGVVVAAGGHSGSLTRDGVVMGTPGYMPPEQAAGEPVDERADVYALGAMLFHTLAGEKPYADAPDVLSAVAAGPPKRLSELCPEAPRDLVAVVEKAMDRQPQDRYPDAAALARDLEAFQAGRFVEAHDYSFLEWAQRWIRRYPLASALIVVLVLGGAVSIAVLVRANQTAEMRRAEADSARAINADLRQEERELRLDLTIEQAATLASTDPRRAIALLAALPDDAALDIRVRTAASEAWSNRPASSITPEPVWIRAVDADATRVVYATESGLQLLDTNLEPGPSVDLAGVRSVALVGDVVYACAERALVKVDASTGAAEALTPQVACVHVQRASDTVAYAATSSEHWRVGPDGLVKLDLPDAYAETTLTPREDGRFWLSGARNRSLSLWEPGRPEPLAVTTMGQSLYGTVSSDYHDAALWLSDGPALRVAELRRGRLTSRVIDVGAPWLELGTWLDRGHALVAGSEPALLLVDIDRGATIARIPTGGRPRGLTPLDATTFAVHTDSGELGLAHWDGRSVTYSPIGTTQTPLPKVHVGPAGVVLTAGTKGLEAHSTVSEDGRRIARHGGRVASLLSVDGVVYVAGSAGIDRIEDGVSERLTAQPTKSLANCGGTVWAGGMEGGVSSLRGGRIDAERTVRELHCSGDTLLVGTEAEIVIVDARKGEPVARKRIPTSVGVRRFLADGDGFYAAADSVWRAQMDGTGWTEVLSSNDREGVYAVLSHETGPVFVEFNESIHFPEQPPRDLRRRITSAVTTGDIVYTGDIEGGVWAWHAERELPIGLAGHVQYVSVLALDPTGTRLASASWDDTARIWDLTADPLDEPPASRPLRGHSQAVVALTWSDVGDRLYTADLAGDVHEWFDPLAHDEAALRTQIRALEDALSGGQLLPDREALQALR